MGKMARWRLPATRREMVAYMAGRSFAYRHPDSYEHGVRTFTAWHDLGPEAQAVYLRLGRATFWSAWSLGFWRARDEQARTEGAE